MSKPEEAHMIEGKGFRVIILLPIEARRFCAIGSEAPKDARIRKVWVQITEEETDEDEHEVSDG